MQIPSVKIMAHRIQRSIPQVFAQPMAHGRNFTRQHLNTRSGVQVPTKVWLTGNDSPLSIVLFNCSITIHPSPLSHTLSCVSFLSVLVSRSIIDFLQMSSRPVFNSSTTYVQFTISQTVTPSSVNLTSTTIVWVPSDLLETVERLSSLVKQDQFDTTASEFG